MPNIEIEMFEVSFSNQNSKAITFGHSFSHTPAVTAIPSGNENIYINNLSEYGCTINSSIDITGTVRVQVMGYV